MASDPSIDETGTGDAVLAPLGGTRAHAVQRLQIGVFGLMAMLLLVGLANIIMDRAQVSQAAAVPEAASTVAPGNIAAPKKDPLADAGVVPDLPADPIAAGTSVSAAEDGGNGAAARP